jgi:hypothetical protein
MPAFSVSWPILLRRGWGLLLLPVLLLTAAIAPTKTGEKPLVLQPVKLPFTPTQFYVAQVKDERPNRSAVAWLLPVPAKPGTLTSAAQPVDLQGGGLAAIQAFVRQSLPRNTALRPIQIRLRQCRVQEKLAPNGAVEGQITLDLAFDYQTSERAVFLTQYRGGARYIRSASDRTPVEPALRQALAYSLSYLNTWLNQAVATDVRLATAVRPSFRYETRRTESDTVFYDASHPLTWADFTGQPRPKGQYAASVFPSFAYQGRPRVRNGVVELDLVLSVFVVRSSSWVAPGQQTAEHLNHEQRHFDIVRLVAERFRRKITPDSLSVEDYNSEIQLKYLKSFTEMNRLQDQYDNETHGALDASVQERWNRRIDEELKKYGVR